MIDIREARRLVMEAARRTAIAAVPISQATGRWNAEDIPSPHDHPLFDMSAVDGYAFAWDDGRSDFAVAGEVAAGSVFHRPLAKGECTRIFTGALIPEGADTVVMQERTERNGDRMAFSDTKLKRGGNVRKRGEQLRTGELLLGAGSLLDAPAVGLLASAGVRSVNVHERPRVNIVRTGGEFQGGASPEPGSIFSSNDAMLTSALAEIGIAPSDPVFAPVDEAAALRSGFEKAISGCDVLISTGGVSVGDHDLVRPTLEALGAEIVFHGVRQKPGKPMLFARLENKLVFALPGNPRAVMVGWWAYVLPLLRAMQGAAEPLLREEVLPIMEPIAVNGDRAEFRAAAVRNGVVSLLSNEGSHMLRSLLAANALAVIEPTTDGSTARDRITVQYLPGR